MGTWPVIRRQTQITAQMLRQVIMTQLLGWPRIGRPGSAKNPGNHSQGNPPKSVIGDQLIHSHVRRDMGFNR